MISSRASIGVGWVRAERRLKKLDIFHNVLNNKPIKIITIYVSSMLSGDCPVGSIFFNVEVLEMSLFRWGGTVMPLQGIRSVTCSWDLSWNVWSSSGYRLHLV